MKKLTFQEIHLDEVLEEKVDPVHWIDVSAPIDEINHDIDNMGSVVQLDYYGTGAGASIASQTPVPPSVQHVATEGSIRSKSPFDSQPHLPNFAEATRNHNSFSALSSGKPQSELAKVVRGISPKNAYNQQFATFRPET